MVPVNPRFKLAALAVALALLGASAFVLDLPPGLSWAILVTALALGSALVPGPSDRS